MSVEWKSINKLAADSGMPETTVRRYLLEFDDYFEYRQENKMKKYRADAIVLLKQIWEWYEAKSSTSEVHERLQATKQERKRNPRLKNGAQKNEVQRNDVHKTEPSFEEVKSVTAELHQVVAYQADVNIEALSRQNELILATLNQLVAGFNRINEQRDEIAQLKREIKELRLQLVSVTGYQMESTVQPFVRANEANTTSPAATTAPTATIQESDLDDLFEHAEHVDEVIPNASVVLPDTIDRKQLAAIIAELRANEHVDAKPSEPVTEAPETHEAPEAPEAPEVQVEASVPSEVVASTQQTAISQSEAELLLVKSYEPDSAEQDSSHLSRVNSRSHTRTRADNKRWWQFWL